MEPWLIWVISGGVLIFLELIIPGLVTVFMGLSAIMVGMALKFSLITGLFNSLIAWFILSTLFLLVLRTFFMKYIGGDSTVHNVDEASDAEGSIVEVTETIEPHKEGRVNFRGVSWQARSEQEILKGSKAIVIGRDGNIWIVKTL